MNNIIRDEIAIYGANACLLCILKPFKMKLIIAAILDKIIDIKKLNNIYILPPVAMIGAITINISVSPQFHTFNLENKTEIITVKKRPSILSLISTFIEIKYIKNKNELIPKNTFIIV